MKVILSDLRLQLCETWLPHAQMLPQRERKGALWGPLFVPSLLRSLKGECQESIRVFFDLRDQIEGAMFIYERISLQGYTRNQYSSHLWVWELENWIKLERGLIFMV